MMLKTPTTSMFITTLALSTTILVSASSWVTLWAALEANTISFIPLIGQSSPLIESTLKYLLTQSSASMLLLALILMSSSPHKASSMLIFLPITIKLGAAPFHGWLVMMIKPLPWGPLLILLTWQKVNPLSLFLFLPSYYKQTTILIFASVGAIWGSMAGLNQTKTNSLLAYSSITHLAWAMTCSLFSPIMFISYLMMYFLITSTLIFSLSSSHFLQFWGPPPLKETNQAQATSVALLSLGGLPPFLGFPMKLLVLTQSSTSLPMLTLTLVSSSAVSLLFYLMLAMNMLTISHKMSKQVERKMLITTTINTLPAIPISTLM